MNAERLLAHYERIADAPDAIARLRRFILDLAVRGKLVPQDPNDEPASELLKRIAAEKARLVKAGEIRKPKTWSAVGESTPFPIPDELALDADCRDRRVESAQRSARRTSDASFVPMPMIAAEYGVANEHEVRAVERDQEGLHAFCRRRRWPREDHAVLRERQIDGVSTI